MKKRMFILLVIFLTFAGIAFISVKTADAQERAFTLTRSVISSGGLGGSADSYTLTSTLGQPVAGSVSGGDFTLASGFWGKALMEWFENFLPLILR